MEKFKRPEILAPVGNTETLRAAVRCGADAVYLGGKELNARRGANNFDSDELESAVKYCHARGVKVYLTLNTLVSDEELRVARNIIEDACSMGIDALIVQDLGLAGLVSSIAPAMPLHASTQMSVQTAEGLTLLKELGFKRVVLPREMSAAEIDNLKSKCDIELEMFIHGALCMCVSGQCYMSAMLGSRSGNRGLCAQPCRLPFSVNSGTGHDLSLKDLSLISHLNDSTLQGITSFKIEGRMKRPEYVAAAVTACKKALDGELSAELMQDLKDVFSRTGFTDGYYSSQLGKNMFGTRLKEDVTSTAPVLSKLSALYEKEPQKIKVDLALTCVQGESLSLAAVACGNAVFVQSDAVPQPAMNKPTTRDAIELQLKKCGRTPFDVNSIDIDLDENIYVPISALNFLRREALDNLLNKLEVSPAVAVTHSTPAPLCSHKQREQSLYARFASVCQIPEDMSGIEKIIVPLSISSAEFKKISAFGAEVIVEIPCGILGAEERTALLLRTAKNFGIKTACVGTLDGLKLAKNEGMDVLAGFGTNIFNSQSLQYYSSLGVSEAILSIEVTLRQAAAFRSNVVRGLIVYGRVPLMLTRNCPAKNATDCSHCGAKGVLVDRMNIEFPLTCLNGFTQVLNSRPIYMADRMDELKSIDFGVLYFTVESNDECRETIKSYHEKSAPRGEFTRGLYYRGVE